MEKDHNNLKWAIFLGYIILSFALIVNLLIRISVVEKKLDERAVFVEKLIDLEIRSIENSKDIQLILRNNLKAQEEMQKQNEQK